MTGMEPKGTAPEAPRRARRRRVLVALDPCEADFADFEASALLAAGLDAELVGLFVEDTSLIAAADLPVTTLVPAGCRQLASVDAAAMRRAFRVAAERAREALSATAVRWRLQWSFEVAQAGAAEQAVAKLTAGDLLALHGAGGARRLRTSRAHVGLRAAGARCPVMILRRGGAERQPVVAVYEGRAPALTLARDLARVHDGPLLILAVAADEARLRQRARRAADWLHGAGVAGRVEAWRARPDAEGGFGGMPLRLRGLYPGFVVIDRRGSLAGRLDLDLLAEEVRASLVVLGGGSGAPVPRAKT